MSVSYLSDCLNKKDRARTMLNAPRAAHHCDTLWRILRGETPRNTSVPARRSHLNHKARQGKGNRRPIACLLRERADYYAQDRHKKNLKSNPLQDTAESYQQAACNIPRAAPGRPDQMDTSSCQKSRSLASPRAQKVHPRVAICPASDTQNYDISPLEKRIRRGWKPRDETDKFEKLKN